MSVARTKLRGYDKSFHAPARPAYIGKPCQGLQLKHTHDSDSSMVAYLLVATLLVPVVVPVVVSHVPQQTGT